MFTDLIHRWRLYHARPDKLNKSKPSDGQGGWVLVDSIIGVTITVTALAAILALYIQFTSVSVSTRDYQNAVYLAQQQLENLRQYDGTATIKDLSPEITDPPTQTINQVKYSIKVRAITPGETLDNRIVPYQVTVTWRDRKNVSSIQSIQVVNYYYSN